MARTACVLCIGIILALSFVCTPPPAGAAGTIDTTNATITARTGMPVGTVEIETAAPMLDPPALPPIDGPSSIGTITGALPTFPGAGNGSDGAFGAATDMVIAGGTFNFSSYSITAGATVEYTTAATIHVTGDVMIDGRVHATAASAGVEFRCGGNVTIASRPTPRNEIRVTGATADLTLHAAGDVTLGTGGTSLGAELRCADGNLTIVAHGTITDGGDVITDQAFLVGDASAPLTVQGAVSVQFGPGFVTTSDGDLLVQAFGGDVTSLAPVATFGTGAIRVEAAQGISIGSGGRVDSDAGDTTMRALNGAVELVDAFARTSGGKLAVHASGIVRLEDGALCEGYPLELIAFGGNVILGVAGSRQCDLEGDGITVRVPAGSFVAEAGSELDCSGAVDVRAATSIDFATGSCLQADSMHWSAGAGGIDIDVSEFRGDGGLMEIQSSGPVRLRGDFEGATGATVRSTGGDIDIDGACIETFNNQTGPSGDVLVEGWQPFCILAPNGQFRSGTSAVAESGDVRLLLHRVVGTVRSFFQPKVVLVKLDGKRPEKSRLKAVGFFDVGPGSPGLGGQATLDVGGTSLTAALDAQKDGRVLRMSEGGIDFRMTRPASGSSRAKFRLTMVGDLAGVVPTEGALPLLFRSGSVEGGCTVSLASGKFKLSRGTLEDPGVFPVRARASVVGGGRDKLALVLGLANDGAPPSTAPETTVTFGSFSVTVPAGEFTDRGNGRFEAKKPPSAAGVKKLTVDYARGLVTLGAAGVDLGTIAEGAVDLTMGVTLEGDGREVEVTATRKGKRLVY